MNRNAYSKNRFLPDVVICHIAQFLSPSDIRNMSQVNQHFRQLFNSPQLWNGIKICMPGIMRKNNYGKVKIDVQVLETIKLRGITELELWDIYHIMGSEINVILQSLPQLEGLTFHTTTIPIFKALQEFASSGHLINLKKLAFGYVDKHCWELSTVQHCFTDLFKQLPRLEEVIFGCDDVAFADSLYALELESDLQRALCYSGKLASVSLVHFTIKSSYLSVLMTKNPHLQTLSLGFIEKFVKDDLVDPTVCSSLTSLDLHHSHEGITHSLLNWAFPGNEPNRNLTSLNVSFCSSASKLFPLLFKLPALRKLNLTKSCIPRNCSFENFHHLQNLEWLELKGCNRISGQNLSELSKSVGKTLHYLGLADLRLSTLITDNHLRDLACMFPVLRSLDLSGCEEITDALLVEWYIKHDETQWPKLKKLVLKNCVEISQAVVNAVRIKARNQLLVDL